MPRKYLLEKFLGVKEETLGESYLNYCDVLEAVKCLFHVLSAGKENFSSFFFSFFILYLIFFFLTMQQQAASSRVWWILECRRRREERREREKGRVLGQADRDVSTAPVILWRLRERQKEKKKRGEGAGWLKDQRRGDSRRRDHPNNSSRGCWEGRGVGERGWGRRVYGGEEGGVRSEARGGSWSSVTHYSW